MSEARRIGELLPQVVQRASRMAQFQALINDIECPASRKQMIMTAKIGNLIDAEECRMLIEVYELEKA